MHDSVDGNAVMNPMGNISVLCCNFRYFTY